MSDIEMGKKIQQLQEQIALLEKQIKKIKEQLNEHVKKSGPGVHGAKISF